MSNGFAIQLDAVAEHVRDLIWQELRVELGLVTCQQGCPEQLRTPADLDHVLPAVLIDPPRWGNGTPLEDGPAIEGTINLDLTLLRRIGAGEEHPRAIIQALQKIAALFCTAGFTLQDWDDGEGLAVDKIWPTEVAHEHDLTYEDSALRVALGHISLQAKVVAYDQAG